MNEIDYTAYVVSFRPGKVSAVMAPTGGADLDIPPHFAVESKFRRASVVGCGNNLVCERIIDDERGSVADGRVDGPAGKRRELQDA